MRGDGVADAGEGDLARDAVETHVAAGGNAREAGCDLLGDLAAKATEERAQAVVDAQLGAVVADRPSMVHVVLPGWRLWRRPSCCRNRMGCGSGVALAGAIERLHATTCVGVALLIEPCLV